MVEERLVLFNMVLVKLDNAILHEHPVIRKLNSQQLGLVLKQNVRTIDASLNTFMIVAVENINPLTAIKIRNEYFDCGWFGQYEWMIDNIIETGDIC